MEYSILKKEKTWANIKVQNRASQKPLTENPLQEDTEGIPVKEKEEAEAYNRRSEMSRKEKPEVFYVNGFQKALALNP